MAHKDDIKLVLFAPDGSWLSATTVDGRNVSGPELKDMEKTVMGRGGLNKDVPFGVAQNDGGLPPPSSKEKDRPWVPAAPRPRKKRRKKK